MTPPDSGEREVLTPIPPPEHFVTVAISLDLAQRILAALEDSLYGRPIGYPRAEALRDDLRAQLPKEPR